ncbi:hypothetical protein F4677DRAFT_194030 [Hypoxylon crocopeplum]|nr:hypothetical protein F4677DRAFT_194030 [Hypoxylon crocopeplum]
MSSLYFYGRYVLRLVKKGLETAANSWEDMRAHFNIILDSDDTTLTPQKHDELLFDDDTFSRSRRYFWAADSLEVFITQIKDAISEWENFWAAREPIIRAIEEVYWRRATSWHKNDPTSSEAYEISNMNLDGVLEQVRRLQNYQNQFEAFLKKTHALRDGLFNASSVIESRAATRLGENVKLLTYVSIFYLPLAFVAALWSINENYSTAAFAITTVLVAIGTYALIGNLENTIDVLRSLYRSIQTPIVDRMSRDKDRKWAEKGEGFLSFQPRREILKPSEWYVGLYWGVEVLRRLRIVPRDTPSPNVGSTPEAVATSSPNPDNAGADVGNISSEPVAKEKGKGAVAELLGNLAMAIRSLLRMNKPESRNTGAENQQEQGHVINS